MLGKERGTCQPGLGGGIRALWWPPWGWRTSPVAVGKEVWEAPEPHVRSQSRNGP